ncbi:hypothetical protein EV401DRAFT_1937739 [Pisolithus croceorrhizus]|nr:hypothetical protein EV401DRAFT_1937739 [Pisolithus croceorrhizus]
MTKRAPQARQVQLLYDSCGLLASRERPIATGHSQRAMSLLPPKRTHKLRTPESDGEDSGDSYSDFRRDLKRARSNSPWNITDNASADNSPLKIYVLSAKFDSTTYQSLVSLVEDRFLSVGENQHPPMRRIELGANIEEADVIVTAIRTRSRLERHVSPSLARLKPIVSAEWLQNSVRSGFLLPCGDYAALRDLREETERSCPDKNQGDVVAPEQPEFARLKPPLFRDPEETLDPRDTAALDYTSRYSCQRGSPLTCPNQGLVRELDIIRRCRFVEGEERSMLSYARAIGLTGLAAYPNPISAEKLQAEVARLPYLGEKILSMIEEYTQSGKIPEAQTILSSPRFQSLSAYTTIYGIGPHTARKLYALGLRTLEELDRYYEVTQGDVSTELMPHFTSDKHHDEEVMTEISIKVGLALRHDFGQLISRGEAEEINRVVMEVLASIQVGCKSLIVGGYRRGKPLSNDVDIVITHSDWNSGSEKVKGLAKRLVQALHEQNLSGFHEHNALRTHHWDSLEKALTVFSLPSDPGERRIHRRVDLIFAAPEVFWTAVVGWTGSTMFQRDLRLWAKQQKGMKFDSSGISRRRDSKLYFPKSEREVFEMLGLAYVHPSLRNADA